MTFEKVTTPQAPILPSHYLLYALHPGFADAARSASPASARKRLVNNVLRVLERTPILRDTTLTVAAVEDAVDAETDGDTEEGAEGGDCNDDGHGKTLRWHLAQARHLL